MIKRVNQIVDSPRFLQMTILLLTALLAIMVVQNQNKLKEQNFSINPPAEEIIVGREIKPVTLKTLDRRDFNFSELPNSYTLLIFFATNCPYCAKDAPLWQKMYEGAIIRNIGIFGITSESDTQVISEYAQKHNILFPILLDQKRELFSQLRIFGTPTKVLLSSDMSIIQVWQGWTTQQCGQSDLGGIYAFFGIAPDDLPVGSSLGDSFSPSSNP